MKYLAKVLYENQTKNPHQKKKKKKNTKKLSFG